MFFILSYFTIYITDKLLQYVAFHRLVLKMALKGTHTLISSKLRSTVSMLSFVCMCPGLSPSMICSSCHFPGGQENFFFQELEFQPKLNHCYLPFLPDKTERSMGCANVKALENVFTYLSVYSWMYFVSRIY